MKFANSTLTANRGDHPSSTIAGGGKSTTESAGNYTTCVDATEFGIMRMAIAWQNHRLAIGAFLGPQERETFARELSAALGVARAGPPL